MGIRVKRCPFCHEKFENSFELDGKRYKYIQKHSNNVKSKTIKDSSKIKLSVSEKISTVRFDIKKYKCVNYAKHGWTEESYNDKNWYHVIFDDKPIHNGKRYYYQESKLYHSDDFIKKYQQLAKDELDNEIINEIQHLPSEHPIYKFFKIKLADILNVNSDSITIPDEIGLVNLQILLYHLKGFSQELIAKILFIKSRATASTVLKELMSKENINIKEFSLNCSIAYRLKDKKIIESKYYNKYSAEDFHYIN